MGEAFDIAHWQIVAAAVLFLVTYAFIMIETIHRAVIALIGALLMVVIRAVSLEAAYAEHIQWETIFLLVGMMVIAGITNRTGLFQYAAVKAAQLAKGDPVRILVILGIVTALLSAFLDNVTTVLLVAPVTFSIARILQVNPLPYLILQIVASNIGGAATMIGDPPNMMIGTANRHLTFNQFLLHLGPVILVILIAVIVLFVILYRKQLIADSDRRFELMRLDAASYITDKPLMIKSVAVLLLTIAGFCLHSVIGLEAAAVAMAGAALLMLIGLKEESIHEALHAADWPTIVFFAGLFVLVGGLADTGMIGLLAAKLLNMTGDHIGLMSVLILWVSGIASAAIDNVPLVAAMIPLIQDAGMQLGAGDSLMDPVWWSLALGASLGGNGTLIGASANVVVAGLAVREGWRLTFTAYLKIGGIVALLSLALCTVYVVFFLL